MPVPPPTSTSVAHAAVTDLVRDLVVDGLVVGVHDTADGVGVALAEMAVRSNTGFQVTATGVGGHRWLFAESASRVVVCAADGDGGDVLRAASSAGVAARRLGTAGGDRLLVEGVCDVALSEAVAAWGGRLPDAFGAGATH